jgi:acyl-CoA synthetase (AMP-forming)/AMP-acid ligase II
VVHAGEWQRSFWDLVLTAAATRPDDVVVADEHGRSLTTAQLAAEAERVAAGLAAEGVAPGDVVSWQLPTSLEAAVLLVACARLGAVQNPIIPVLRAEVGAIVRQLGPRVLIVPERWGGYEHGAAARELGVPVLALDLEAPPGPGLRLPTGSVEALPPPPEAAPGACRWIYYSSGTTAEPKGARHSDASVVAGSSGMVDAMGMTVGEVYPIAWPISHVGGVAMLSAALRAGGSLVMFERFDPATTGERMAEHRPTILGSATPFFAVYVAAQRRAGSEPLYPDLRGVVGGGAPTPTAVNDEVVAVLGVSGVVASWGLTEFPAATSESPDDPAPGTTVGRPVAGVSVRVVDGELRLKGPQCFLGYVDASLDADAFDDEGWFRTGDLGSVDDDGRVRIEGRSKDVIIRNPENISSLEDQGVLLSHPDVADVAVIGVPHERTGEQVCAVVVARPGAEVALADLVEHCRAEGLARHKCPERLEVVDALPRSPMGKVLKRSIVLP